VVASGGKGEAVEGDMHGLESGEGGVRSYPAKDGPPYQAYFNGKGGLLLTLKKRKKNLGS